MSRYDLSIVIPVLNEASELPHCLTNLACQEGLRFEVIVCDGGSTDGTPILAAELADSLPFPLTFLVESAGRARQLNAGARAASAGYLLFLHADSRFPDSRAISSGLQALCRREHSAPGRQVAGHFRLRFRCTESGMARHLYFWEAKARLSRPDCTHGDQGFLLSSRLFAERGPFDEELPVAADTRFAESIRIQGEWILLPAEISTSARRFEVEGLRERQILNALLMNFLHIGWSDYFRHARGLYRVQSCTGRIALIPSLDLIGELLQGMPLGERLRLWYRTGEYVRQHAWQIPFRFDAGRAQRLQLPPGEGAAAFLRWHDFWFDRLTDHPVGYALTGGLVWIWFQALRWRENRRLGTGS